MTADRQAAHQFERDMRSALLDIERATEAEGIAFTPENVAAECRRRGFPDHTAEAFSGMARVVIDERAGGR